MNTLEPSQAPGGYIHRCYQTNFLCTHKVETVPSQVHVLISPLRTKAFLRKATYPRSLVYKSSGNLNPKADALTTMPPYYATFKVATVK